MQSFLGSVYVEKSTILLTLSQYSQVIVIAKTVKDLQVVRTYQQLFSMKEMLLCQEKQNILSLRQIAGMYTKEVFVPIAALNCSPGSAICLECLE